MSNGRTNDLCLGSTSPNKVVHHRGCQHARRDYGYARRFPTLRAFADELARTGAWEWHRPCRLCCRDLADEMQDALMRPCDSSGRGTTEEGDPHG